MGLLTTYVTFMAGVMVGLLDALVVTMNSPGISVLVTCLVGVVCGVIAACILKLHEGFIATLAMVVCAWPLALITCAIERPFYTALGMAQIIVVLHCTSAYIGVWIGEGMRIALHRLARHWNQYSTPPAS